MAIVVNEPKVGQRVYRHGKPQQAGVITEVYGKGDVWHRVRVKWLWQTNSSREEVTDTAGLKDFDALIEDHRKKLNTHLATLKRLESL